MTAILSRLFQVDEMDAKLEQVAEQKGRSRVADFEQRLEMTRQRRAATQEGLARFESCIAAHESRLAELQTLIVRNQSKLYSGNVTNARELASSEEELKAAMAERSQVEDEILQAMESAEQAARTLVQVDRDIAELSGDVEEARQDEIERQQLLDRRCAEFTQARNAAWADLPRDIQERYQRLRQTGRDPVVRVKGGMCQGCRMDIPNSHWRGVKQGQLLNCPTCGRFLREM